MWLSSALADTMDLYVGHTFSRKAVWHALFYGWAFVTLDQMSEELGMSKPTMSTSIRSLQNIDMVHKVWKKGVRKDLIWSRKDFSSPFFTFSVRSGKREISVNLEAIEEAENKLQILLNNEDVPEEIAVKAKRNLAQIIESKHYYHFLKK